MRKLFNFFRDPVWAAIGALGAVIALFWNYGATEKPIGEPELSIIHIGSEMVNRPLFPSDNLQLLVKGRTGPEGIDNVAISYFYFRSTKAIKEEDFRVPVTLSEGSGVTEILLAESCTENLAQACSDNSANTRTSQYTPISWTKGDTSWISSIDLINPGETACTSVMYLMDPTADSKSVLNMFKWTVRITGVTTKIYGSFEEYRKENTEEPNVVIQQIESIHFELSGSGIYWFFALFGVCFCSLFLYSCITKWIQSDRIYLATLKALAVASLSISMASVIITAATFERGIASVHPFGWGLLAIYFALFAYIAFVTRSRQESEKGPGSINMTADE